MLLSKVFHLFVDLSIICFVDNLINVRFIEFVNL